jgi:hypothetical protein
MSPLCVLLNIIYSPDFGVLRPAVNLVVISWLTFGLLDGYFIELERSSLGSVVFCNI